MPASRHSTSFHVSEKKPRSSEKRSGRISSTPSMAVSRRLIMVQLGHAPHQIMGIVRITQPLGAIDDFSGGEVAELERNLLKAHHFEALAALDRTHEGRGVVEAFMGAGIQPRKAAAKSHDVEIAAFQIRA